MDPSAVEKAIKILESHLTSLGYWLEFWTALVVIGLIVEYFEDIKDLVVKKPPKPKLLRAIIGGVLITVGVSGELAIQFKAGNVETALRNANHVVVAQLNEKAQEALEKAKAEELERAKLEELVAPRRLTLEQQRTIADSCKRFAGRPITITSYLGDGESMVLAEQIAAALQAARLKVALNLGDISVSGQLMVGVQILGPPSKSDLIWAIRSSLRDEGHLTIAGPKELPIPPGHGFASMGGGHRYGPEEASIFVGVRPPVLLPVQ